MFKHYDRQEMTDEHAAQIVNDLLDVFQLLFTPSIQTEPVVLSYSKEEGWRKVTTITIDSCMLTRKVSYSRIKKNTLYEYFVDNIYVFIINGRHYEITLFGDPEDCGYCSILPDYNPSTYVLCNIVEKRKNGAKKHEMAFGFDIEKSTFLELFEIVHYNFDDLIREYPHYYTPIETQLKDAVIIL